MGYIFKMIIRDGVIKGIIRIIGTLLLVSSGLARDFPVKGLHRSQNQELCQMFNPIPLYTFHQIYGSSTPTTDTYNNPNIWMVIGAEFLGATVGTVVTSISLSTVTYHIVKPSPMHESMDEMNWLIVLGAGYIVGFPLGSALGTYFTGALFQQSGSFSGSLAGGTAGMVIAMCASVIGAIIWEITDGGLGGLYYAALVSPLPFILPQIGAVIGYNRSRKPSHSVEQQGFMFDIPQLEICATKNSSYSQGFKIKMTLLNIKF